MDTLTPRSRQAGVAAAATAAATQGADQETLRAGNAEEDALLRKDFLLAAAAARASPRAAGGFGVVGGAVPINLKQLAAAARAATQGCGSGAITPRGALARATAAAAAEAGGLPTARSPRGDDQTPRQALSTADEATVPAPAAATLEPAGAVPAGDGPAAEAGSAPSSVRLQELVPARAQPGLQVDVEAEAPPVRGAPPLQPPLLASASPWPARSSGGGALPLRRLTGPGGLTAAEILLMDARRPSWADSADDLDLHWGQHYGHGHGHAHHAPAVESITEEAAAAAAAAAAPGSDAAPVGIGRGRRWPCRLLTPGS
jgi:hypothetical protein